MKHHRYLRAWLIALGLVSFAGVAQAGESDNQWQFGAAIYLWGADIGGETSNGTGVEVEFKDLLDNLEMAFMGSFEARKNKWLMFTDLIYLDVSAGQSSDFSIPVGPGIPVEATADLDLEGLVVHLAGGYNFYNENNSTVDLIGGLRYLDIDTEVFLGLESVGPGQSMTIEQGDTVWDAIVGVKGQLGLSERWFIPYYLDIGAGDSDFTWQATAGISFRAAKWADVALVYRHLEWDMGSGSLLNDISFSGPAFGAIFRW